MASNVVPVDERKELQEKIKNQGDVVRKLKSEKAEKAQVLHTSHQRCIHIVYYWVLLKRIY